MSTCGAKKTDKIAKKNNIFTRMYRLLFATQGDNHVVVDWPESLRLVLDHFHRRVNIDRLQSDCCGQVRDLPRGGGWVFKGASILLSQSGCYCSVPQTAMQGLRPAGD